MISLERKPRVQILRLKKKIEPQFRSNREQLECINHFLLCKGYFDLSIEMELGVRHWKKTGDGRPRV